MADNQLKLDAQKALITQRDLGQNAPALQGLEFDLPQYNAPSTELEALNDLENGNSIIDRVQEKSPVLDRAAASQKAMQEQIALKKGQLGLPGGVQPQPEVVTQDQLQLPQQPQSQQVQVPSGPELGAYNKVIKGLENAAMVGQQAAAQEIAAADAYAQKMEEFDRKNEEDRNKRQQEIDAKILAAQEEVEKIADGQVDPNRVFSSMSFGQKFANALLLGIAGNRGAETIDRMIRTDIAAQENLKKSKLDAANNKVTMFQEFRNKLKDDILAREALRASMYQVAQMKLGAIGAQTKSAQVAAQIQAQIGELELKKQEVVQKYQERANNIIAQQQMGQFDPVTAKINQLPENLQKPLLEAKEVYDSTQAAFKTIDDIFSEAEGITALSAINPYGDAAAKVDANNANIESAIRATMKGQGTIQESEIERLVKPLLPLPKDSVSRIRIKKERLKQLLSTKNAGQISRLQNLGLIPKQFSPSTAKKN